MATINSTRLLKINFPDVETLHACFMPFLQNGGIFIPGTTYDTLGERVMVLLELPGDPAQRLADTTVVWINPSALTDSRASGAGLQFSTADAALSDKIRAMLADYCAHSGADKPALRSATLQSAH